MTDLRDKPILITGASSGIGRATAIACARAGMRVVLAARRADKLHEVQDQIAQETKPAGRERILIVPCDLSRQEECVRLMDVATARCGSLYAIFANAGYGLEKSVIDSTDDEIRAMFELNFWHGIHLFRAFVASKQPLQPTTTSRGHFLFCSSCLSKIGVPLYSAYCASKMMQDAFARAARHELAPVGIHVSSVHPIGTRTELFDKIQEHGGTLVMRTSERFMHPPERVAHAVVRRLRKSRRGWSGLGGGEVWTSTPMRIALGLGMMAPGLTDWMIAKILSSRQRR
jgi:NAD(P)-dependent dehydrogenase (short-subunit alcohol dehydrogenase family)